MQHQLIVDILEALHTIELFEDLIGTNLDSDGCDQDYYPNTQDFMPQDMPPYCMSPASPEPFSDGVYFSEVDPNMLSSCFSPASPCEPSEAYFIKSSESTPSEDNTCPFSELSQSPEANEWYSDLSPQFTTADYEAMYNIDGSQPLNYSAYGSPLHETEEPTCEFTTEYTSPISMDECPEAAAPSTAPLQSQYRQPNDGFHNVDPYMYYESREYPSDEDYMNAIATLAQANELITNDEDYFRLECPAFHHYVNSKTQNIDTRLTRRQRHVIQSFYQELEHMYASMANECDRLADLHQQRESDDFW